MFPAWEKTEKQGFSHKSHTCENQDVFKEFFSGAGDNYDKGLLGAGWGPPPETFCISRLPKLDFM